MSARATARHHLILILCAFAAVSGVTICPARDAVPEAAANPLAKYAPSEGYTVEPYGLVKWDNGLRTPRWVLHQINEKSVVGPAMRPSSFHADPGIDDRWQTHPNWFLNSGFDRGHCAPCADFKHSQKITDACMSLKNIMVQASYLNEHPWEQLEETVRAATNVGHTVTIITGPAWKSAGVKSCKVVNGMVAGTHCFKAILIEKEDSKECKAWLAPNIDNPGTFDSWRLSTDELEEVIGEDLWPNLTPKEAKELEAKR